MGKSLFSVPIFFIVFRETLEAAIIISVLLGLVEQIVQQDPNRATDPLAPAINDRKDSSDSAPVLSDPEEQTSRRRLLIRKLRIQVCRFVMSCVELSKVLQIFLGAGLGLLASLSVGAAYVLNTSEANC